MKRLTKNGQKGAPSNNFIHYGQEIVKELLPSSSCVRWNAIPFTRILLALTLIFLVCHPVVILSNIPAQDEDIELYTLAFNPTGESAEVAPTNSSTLIAPTAAVEVMQTAITETTPFGARSVQNKDKPFLQEVGRKALMIIAAFPDIPMKYDVIWSQLECFAHSFDQIIISAPTEFKENVTQFVEEVNNLMPIVGTRIKAQFYTNDRYDAGLWCDALTAEGFVPQKAKDRNNTAKGISQQYERVLLINDSMMAIKKSNEFLEALELHNASLIALNYWGDEEQYRNFTKFNATETYNHRYWLESPLRAFSLEGVNTYADKVCSLPQIQWKRDCPHLRFMKNGSTIRDKRCIVEKTEIDVVNHYPSNKVHGLYPEFDEKYKTWSNNFLFWSKLHDKMGFPVVKVNSGPLIKDVMRRRPTTLGTCMQRRRK